MLTARSRSITATTARAPKIASRSPLEETTAATSASFLSLASVDSEISTFDNLIIQGYRFIKKYSLTTEEMYGLELANVEVETVPIMVGPVAKVRIKREKDEVAKQKEAKYMNFGTD